MKKYIKRFNSILVHVRTASSTAQAAKMLEEKKSPTFELMRNFIDDCLYNSDYGYFNRHVQILTLPQALNFNSLKDQDDYNRLLREIYREESKRPQSAKDSTGKTSDFRPLWHTPSELFKPHYGRMMANFLVASHNSNSNLVIYELGPGNGTLAQNVLDVLKSDHPQLYKKTEYNLVEISARLSQRQVQAISRSQHPVRFVDPAEMKVDERECWVWGLEVLDNLTHDLIKYRNEDGVLLEGTICSDPDGGYGNRLRQEFQVARDPVILEFVEAADALGWKSPSLQGRSHLRILERFSPVSYLNPWSCEYIPTGAFMLLKRLISLLPRHRALFSDFDSLPEAIAGHNGPMVQTRFRETTVACSTILLSRGLFDIFFPVNFYKLAQLYQYLRRATTGNASQSILKHAEFAKKWLSKDELGGCKTRSGYNPLLEDFSNVSIYHE